MILQFVGLVVVVAVIAVGANWILKNVRFGAEKQESKPDNQSK